MLIGLIIALSALSAVGAFAASGWESWYLLPVTFVGSFLFFALLAFLVLWISCLVVDLEKPQKKDSKYYRFLCTWYAPAALTIVGARVHKSGLEKVPEDGRFLLVCNHLDILDPVLLLSVLPKAQLAFISKKENRDMFIVGKLMHKITCQMIDRENDRKALETILTCVRLIKEDQVSVAVFPEGYTSLDGLLHPFRSGVFKIAQRANVPVVVCALQNTQYALKNALKLKPTHIHFHVLDVIPAEKAAQMTATELGDLAHSMMAADLGEDKVLKTD